jgi:malate dehydrogenase (quinone)
MIFDRNVIIEGLGVTGMAVLLHLALFTNVNHVTAVDRRPGPAQVNSSPENNSQTEHQGEAESNYNRDKVIEVHAMAQLQIGFIENFAPHAGRRIDTHMIGVGAEEVALFEERFEWLVKLLPHLRLLRRAELAIMEPKLIEGRDPNEPIISIYSNRGFMVDFQQFGEAMLDKTMEMVRDGGRDFEILFNTDCGNERRIEGGFALTVGGREVTCRVLEIAKGNGSILVAHRLGYGSNLVTLPVGGGYYVAPVQVNSKVYGFQDDRIPLAAVHLDPDLNNAGVMRFGPTAEPIPMLEPDSLLSAWEFMKTGTLTPRGLFGVCMMLTFNLFLVWFGLRNMRYRIPFVGKWLFARYAAQKIMPSIRARDLTRASGKGGVRGQLVDLDTWKLSKLTRILPPKGVHANCIPAPSPGASAAMGNAVISVRNIVKWLGPEYTYDEAAMREAFAVRPRSV